MAPNAPKLQRRQRHDGKLVADHPLGFVLLLSHIILFAVFVRFELRYRWILWPLTTGLF